MGEHLADRSVLARRELSGAGVRGGLQPSTDDTRLPGGDAASEGALAEGLGEQDAPGGLQRPGSARDFHRRERKLAGEMHLTDLSILRSKLSHLFDAVHEI